MTYTWSEVYDYACKAFGQTPRPEDEAVIIEHFEQNPLHVMREIDRVATALSEGKVRYAWSAFAGRIKQEHKPLREAVADDQPNRERRILNAETWIRNAGLHYDREDHVLADLFGDDYARGPLTDYDTPELRLRMTNYWHEHRPRGEQAEQDHEAWNAKCKADHQIMLEVKAKQQAEAKAKYALPKTRMSDEEYFEQAEANRMIPALRSKPTSEDIDFS